MWLTSNTPESNFYGTQSKLFVVFKWRMWAELCDWLRSLLTASRQVSLWWSVEQVFRIPLPPQQQRFILVSKSTISLKQVIIHTHLSLEWKEQRRRDQRPTQLYSSRLWMNKCDVCWKCFCFHLQVGRRGGGGVRKDQGVSGLVWGWWLCVCDTQTRHFWLWSNYPSCRAVMSLGSAAGIYSRLRWGGLAGGVRGHCLYMWEVSVEKNQIPPWT